jgi:hypothetical protein
VKGGLPVDKRFLASAQEAVDPRPAGLQHSILLNIKNVLSTRGSLPLPRRLLILAHPASSIPSSLDIKYVLYCMASMTQKESKMEVDIGFTMKKNTGSRK